MKTGLYKDSGGGDQNVIEVDEVGKRVLVDYGDEKTVWYGEEDYCTWVLSQDIDNQEPPRETLSEEPPKIPDNTVKKEPRKRTPATKKTAVKKPPKPKPKKK